MINYRNSDDGEKNWINVVTKEEKGNGSVMLRTHRRPLEPMYPFHDIGLDGLGPSSSLT